MTEQGTRKPTTAQARLLRAAISNGRVIIARSSVRSDVHDRMISAGYIDSASWRITRAGYMAVGMADRFALPEVKVGDLLRYVTHPGCVVRVQGVLDGGRIIRHTYVTICGTCKTSSGAADNTERFEPDYGHMHPQTLDGQRDDAWSPRAFLLEPLPADDAAQTEQDIIDTRDAYAADRASYDNGLSGFPTPLYADTIRPSSVRWPVGRTMGELTPGQRLVQTRRAAARLQVELDSNGAAIAAAMADEPVVAAAAQAQPTIAPGSFSISAARELGATVAPESFHTQHGVLDGPAAQRMRDELIAEHARDLGVSVEDAERDLRRRADALDPAAAAAPRFPAGTAEYEQYAAELKAELRKWVNREQPYGDGEPETAVGRLSEEYGQNENDHDRSPTDAGFEQWLAEQVERLRVEVALRDAGRRANLGIAQLVRAYGVQLVKGDAAGAAAALNAVQDHVAGLLAGLALAGGERVRKTFEECEGALRAAGLAGGEDVRRTIEARKTAGAQPVRSLPDARTAGELNAKLRDERDPAPFAVGDRVTWGRADTIDGLRVWHVTRVWRGDDGRWSVAARLAGGRGQTGTAAPADQFNRLPAMPEAHRVFTFGTAHSHPDAPAGDLGKHFVRIPGDAETARARMLATFGRNWAFDYAPMRFEPQVEQYGLIEVAPPSFLAGMVELADDPDLRAYVIEQLGSQQLDGLAAELRYGPAAR